MEATGPSGGKDRASACARRKGTVYSLTGREKERKEKNLRGELSKGERKQGCGDKCTC